jgi:hypothetical protein
MGGQAQRPEAYIRGFAAREAMQTLRCLAGVPELKHVIEAPDE